MKPLWVWALEWLYCRGFRHPQALRRYVWVKDVGRITSERCICGRRAHSYWTFLDSDSVEQTTNRKDL